MMAPTSSTGRRVLVLGSAKAWRAPSALARAFQRAGHEAEVFDPGRARTGGGVAATQRAILDQFRSYRADCVVIWSGSGVIAETVNAMRSSARVIVWFHRAESPPSLRDSVDRWALTLGQAAHTFFVTSRVPAWKALGLNARYLPMAGDAEVVPPPGVVPDQRTISFIGAGYSESRRALIRELARELPVRVWGAGWEGWTVTPWAGVPRTAGEYSEICTRSTLVLGVNPRAEQGRIFPSDRVWSTLLARGLYVGERADSLVPLLQHGEHCVWFRNADECLRHCVELLSDCELREHIRDTGERHARENHTFDQRVPLILGEQEYVCRDETRVPYACSGSGGVVAGSSGIESSSSLQVEIAK